MKKSSYTPEASCMEQSNMLLQEHARVCIRTYCIILKSVAHSFVDPTPKLILMLPLKTNHLFVRLHLLWFLQFLWFLWFPQFFCFFGFFSFFDFFVTFRSFFDPVPDIEFFMNSLASWASTWAQHGVISTP